MALTEKQLYDLKTDLQRLARVEYDDVLNEILDHYASLTEERMANDLTFENASRWAWSDMGGGDAIQQIQDDFVKNIRRQVGVEHLAVVKSYFRWPTIVTTALVAALVYFTVPVLPTEVVESLFWVAALLPVGLLVWQHFQTKPQPNSTGFLVRKRLNEIGGRSINIVLWVSIYSGGYVGESAKRTAYLQTHTMVSVVLCLLFLLYMVSFIQLIRRPFTYQSETA